LFQKNIQNTINESKKRLFFEKTDQEPKETFLYSSNVYANRYFDLKLIFKYPDLFCLIVYEMVRRIGRHYRNDYSKFDAFICASVNGACLANAVSVLIRKPVVFLRNVGPRMNVVDENITKRILREKRYVFIYDFLCIGTEFRRIEMLS
jgi:adenine/guanine phosphoribosyltransferase-like PRPP-binding protein